ncbi:MAG TPA: NAD(P)-binding domain-containing protein [Blastocatellia bacterium]|jgi:pyrroline-5-carboxylate reductase
MNTNKEVVAILGCGTLGSIIAKGLQVPGGEQPYDIIATHHSAERAEELSKALGVPCVVDNRQACENATIVILAVRPQAMADLLKEVSPSLKPGTLCISIAAALPLKFYEELLPDDVPIIRAHPSPMMEVRRGFIALAAGTKAEPIHIEKAKRLFSVLCEDTLLSPESDIDLFASVFGSSSALLYLFVDALVSVEECKGEHGFSPLRVVAGMLDGAAQMLVKTNRSPRMLSEEICTPGGVTITGVKAWEENKVSQLVTVSMETILLRVKNMSRGAR